MTKHLSFTQKYSVLGSRSIACEGLFVTAVKTTGIFCRPSCRARVPKAENVIFYDTAEQALQNGFRPCKICKPMQPLDETPKQIQNIIKELHIDPYLRIKDHDLRSRGIEPNQIRRWFKKHHNITFHAYQRMLRINTAFTNIRKGQSITNSAFDSGYQSLSGFNQGCHSVFGDNPTAASSKAIINISRFTTSLGPMFACASQRGICLLEFTDRRALETEFGEIRKQLNAVILPGKNPHLTSVQNEITRYFNGTLTEFNTPVDAPGTPFQQQVWQRLREIPYGHQRSYKEQARVLGKPSAIRAVASANGHNRIAIIIPCHRVLGANGSLTGYGGGLWRKQSLLDLEAQNSNQKETR
jgi:AraC family transcriptional regulator of adaptative response/methylated-DNA-[protein]-cysteine methyltransferase